MKTLLLLIITVAMAVSAENGLEEPHGRPIKTDGEKAFVWNLKTLILHADDFEKIDLFANSDVVISAWKRKGDDAHMFFTFQNRNHKRMRAVYTLTDGQNKLGEYEIYIPKDNQEWQSHVVFMNHKPLDHLSIEMRASAVDEQTAEP